jgi:hypothetical protein
VSRKKGNIKHWTPQNKPKAEVHLEHLLMGPKEEEEGTLDNFVA